jgi:hypothetical protein
VNWRRRAKRHLRSCLLHLCSPFLPDFPFLDRHVTWLPLRMYLRLYSICVCVYVCVCAYISCGCPVICKARHGISLLDTFQLFRQSRGPEDILCPRRFIPCFCHRVHCRWLATGSTSRNTLARKTRCVFCIFRSVTCVVWQQTPTTPAGIPNTHFLL